MAQKFSLNSGDLWRRSLTFISYLYPRLLGMRKCYGYFRTYYRRPENFTVKCNVRKCTFKLLRSKGIRVLKVHRHKFSFNEFFSISVFFSPLFHRSLIKWNYHVSIIKNRLIFPRETNIGKIVTGKFFVVFAPR